MTPKQSSYKTTFSVHGMHCGSCEVLIEQKIKTIHGVKRVSVHHQKQKAIIEGDRAISREEIDEVIREDGYSVSDAESIQPAGGHAREYGKTCAIFLVVLGLYLLAKQLNILPNIGVSQNMGYALVFAIGIVAAFSTCLAVTGGLLLAIGARYAKAHPNISGVKKFAPHITFNAGRLVSYTMFGALVGAMGSLFTFSAYATGAITLAASAAMILLGLNLLKLLPAFRLSPGNKRIAHALHAFSKAHPRTAPFLLGGSTFFLPCGFTQALQLYILTTGSPLQGAATMLVFALGTAPALLSLGAISSFVKGAWQGYLLKGAGALVILIGISSVGNGLRLVGARIGFSGAIAARSTDPNVVIEKGKQIVSMKVIGLEYVPHQFRVKQGIPVEWRIDGRGAEGCAQVITAQKLNLLAYLPKNTVKTVTFTPNEVGKIPFSCTMGMTTPGAAFIVENNGNVAVTPITIRNAAKTENGKFLNATQK